MTGRRAYGAQANHPEELHANADELTIFDPNLVLGYFRRLETILEACPIDIYAASSFKHPWPYRLQNAAECHPASFWRSQHRILDSAILSPELSNQDVLDHAVERRATAVVAKDYMPFDIYEAKYKKDDLSEEGIEAARDLREEYGDNITATTESIREFANLYTDDHPPAYIPIQPPYDEHVREVIPILDDAGIETRRFMLGGLKDAPPNRRINELLSFRSEVGPDPIAHGLGWGLSDDLVMALRDAPELLDSVDNSSPAQAIQGDSVLDKHWRGVPCETVGGRYQNSVGGASEFWMLLQGAHRLTEFNDDYDEVPQQKGLGDFGGARADD